MRINSSLVTIINKTSKKELKMFKEKKTVRGELIKARRLKEVIDKLNTVFLLDGSDYPVYPFQYNRKGELINRISTKTILDGALVYLAKMYVNENELVLSDEELEALEGLGMFFRTKLEMHMHNYANSCAHREQPTEKELENIRVLSVLSSSIDYFAMEMFEEEDYPFWDIPEGWKKK